MEYIYSINNKRDDRWEKLLNHLSRMESDKLQIFIFKHKPKGHKDKERSFKDGCRVRGDISHEEQNKTR
jgi:hypothetical protein